MRKLLIASTLGIVFLAGAWFGQGNVGNVTTPVEHSVYSSGLKNSEVHHQQPIGLQKQILSELWLSTKAQYMHMTLFVFFVWALMLLAVCVRMRSWLKKDHVDCCDMVPAATAMGKLTHSSRGIGDGYLARQIDQAANTIPVKAPRVCGH